MNQMVKPSSDGIFGIFKHWFGSAPKEKVVVPVRGRASAWMPQSVSQTRVAKRDMFLFWLLVAMMCFGVVMVFSASIAMPGDARFKHLGNSYFLNKHLISIALGFVGMLVMQLIPLSVWQRYSGLIFAFSMLSLIAVLVFGDVIKGARRWVSLGLMNFQPTELVKFATVLYVSGYMVRKMELKERFFKAVTPVVIAIGLAGLLILAQPDMGAFMVIAVIAMGILFLGGVNARMFFLMTCVLTFAFISMVVSSPYRMERVLGYLQPWDPEYVNNAGYQLTNSLMALGLGNLTGTGLGNSIAKLNWLPEAHTDFLIAVIGEELGFIGVAAVIIVFFAFVRRIILIGRQAIVLDRVFSGLAAQGIALWFGFQAFVHIGVNLGALPTKGLTLPLVSYGGSAILMNMIAIGLVFRVDRENRALMRGESQ